MKTELRPLLAIILLIAPFAGCTESSTATRDSAETGLTAPVDTLFFAAPEEDRTSPFAAFQTFPIRITGFLATRSDGTMTELALDQATDLAANYKNGVVEKFDELVAAPRGVYTATGVRVESTGAFILGNGETTTVDIPDPLPLNGVDYAVPGTPELSFIVLWFTLEREGNAHTLVARAEPVTSPMTLMQWWAGEGEVLVRLATAKDARSHFDVFSEIGINVNYVSARTTHNSDPSVVVKPVTLTATSTPVDLGVVAVREGALDRVTVALNLTHARDTDGNEVEVKIAPRGIYFAGRDAGAAWPEVMRGKRVTVTFYLAVAENEGEYFLQSRPDLSG